MTAVDRPEPGLERLPPLRRNRDFMLLWSGAAMSILGSRVAFIAYPLLALWHTESPTAAGLVMFAALLPNLLLQLPAGVLVDRLDRRRVMICCDIGSLAAAGVVAVTVLLGQVWLVLLMAMAFVSSGFSIGYLLAERSGVRNLVAAPQLPPAMARNEARGRIAGLVGQPVGSLLFALARAVPFVFTALAHAASLVALLLIKKSLQVGRSGPPRRLVAELAEGLTWTWRRRLLRTVLGLLAATNILFQGLALAVMVIVQQDGGSPMVVGLILAAGGAGGAIGAASATWWRRAGLRAIVLSSMVTWALLMPWLAVVREPILLGLLFAVMSYGGGVVNVVGSVYQIRITPDAIQGRVGSAMLLMGSGATSMGALAGGISLDAFGVTWTVLTIGGVMVVLAALAAMSPALRTAPDHGSIALAEQG